MPVNHIAHVVSLAVWCRPPRCWVTHSSARRFATSRTPRPMFDVVGSCRPFDNAAFQPSSSVTRGPFHAIASIGSSRKRESSWPFSSSRILAAVHDHAIRLAEAEELRRAENPS